MRRLQRSIGSTRSLTPCEMKMRGLPRCRVGTMKPGANASTWLNKSPLVSPNDSA